jgi:hypothetical protein
MRKLLHDVESLISADAQLSTLDSRLSTTTKRRRSPPPSHPFTLLDQLEWAEGIGRGVAYKFKFVGQELDDLVSVATVMLCDLYTRPVKGTWNKRRKEYVRLGFDVSKVPEKFKGKAGDPEGLFRGWAYRWIKSECNRAAEKLRNGGTYNTTRPENRPGQVIELGDLADGISDDRDENDDFLNHPPTRQPSISSILDALHSVPYGRRLARGQRETS